jgi:hypothetical protein
MRTIQLYGVTHAYPYENNKLPLFLRECCEAIDLTVPVEQINSPTNIQKAFLNKIKNNHKNSIELSWRENPEQMGR